MKISKIHKEIPVIIHPIHKLMENLKKCNKLILKCNNNNNINKNQDSRLNSLFQKMKSSYSKNYMVHNLIDSEAKVNNLNLNPEN